MDVAAELGLLVWAAGCFWETVEVVEAPFGPEGGGLEVVDRVNVVGEGDDLPSSFFLRRITGFFSAADGVLSLGLFALPLGVSSPGTPPRPLRPLRPVKEDDVAGVVADC